jgi:signal transduction histidine kinase
MLSRIGVSYKLLLIYALDMVAVIFLGYSLAEEKYIAINFAKKEVAGNAYMSAVRDSVFAMIDFDAAARGTEPAAVEKAASLVKAQMAAVTQAERDYGQGLDSAAMSTALVREGRRVTMKPEQTDVMLRQGITASRNLLARIGDQSNLILDPDLDSYYSMSLVLLRFPELTEVLVTLGDNVRAAGRGEHMDNDQRSELLVIEGRLTSVIKGIQDDLAAGYRGNPDGSLAQALDPGYLELSDGLEKLTQRLRETVVSGTVRPADSAAISTLIGGVLSSSHASWIATAQELDRLLDLRISGFFHRMAVHFGLAGLILAVILALVLAVGRRIARPIAHLAAVAGQVRQTNDYTLRAHWQSSDEIGRLVEAFNSMLERLQAENAREQEMAARSRAAEAQHDLVEAIPIPLVVSRLSDQVILHLNQPAALLLGSRSDDPAKSGALDAGWLSGADRGRLLDGLGTDGAINEFEVECSTHSGARFWALVSARLLTYQGEAAVLTTVTPIDERHRMEEELRGSKESAEATLSELRAAQQSLIQAEKMASLGGLVAGVAHEINTPVGIGLTGASMMVSETAKIQKLYAADEMSQADFEDFLSLADETSRLLVSNMDRAAGLIQSFKQVAVDQTSAERRSFNLGSYIDEVLASLIPAIKRGRHEISVDCPDNLLIDTFPGALSQVLTNLVMNSILHAYDDDRAGKLSISVRPIDGKEFKLVYADDGCGISPETLPRIFDPFFTTKRGSGGSGLGLHIVYNMVTSSLQGQISVHSTPGEGTSFTLRLPCEVSVERALISA